jgi:hypothetical protein
VHAPLAQAPGDAQGRRVRLLPELLEQAVDLDESAGIDDDLVVGDLVVEPVIDADIGVRQTAAELRVKNYEAKKVVELKNDPYDGKSLFEQENVELKNNNSNNETSQNNSMNR